MEADYSIPPRGELTIGYNSNHGSPRQYYLDPRKGVDIEIGVVKLFLATDWADFSNIRQESPFDDILSRGNRPVETQTSKYALWDEIRVPVIVREHGKSDEQR